MNAKTKTNLLLVLGILYLPFLMNAQSSYRSIDGTYNNISVPQLGATHSPMRQATTVGFADGASTPGLVNNPNPRTISNRIFAQNGLVNDPLQLSDFTWVFGQFLDHDITLVGDDHSDPVFINIPSGDQWFDPFFQGTAIIPMFRSLPYQDTGDSPNNPRVYGNEITHWIDGSNVYGSNNQRAFWLRTFNEGKLKTSAGDLLPYNTTTGELNDPIDPNAPAMDNAVGAEQYLFVAGDARANENILLISLHTLFVREHNRICDEILAVTPGLSDEIVYQTARKKVGAILQSIVYNEWLPAMGIHLEHYTGYDPTVDPSISNVFSAAAFRMGHTLLNSNIMRIGNDGNVIPEGNVTLQEAFFRPSLIQQGGISPLFKGMGVQVEQNLDGKIVDDVRNFLFGPPGAGGLDLAAINIQRGRERGLSDFNTIREDFYLAPYNSFSDVNSDPNILYALEDLYDSVDDIDPWVGMLVEEHMPGALVGETIMQILTEQFRVLRDGDRFYFEDDPLLTTQDIEEIKNTTLADIIKRNTDISLMQDNVFEAMPHDQICPAPGPYADLEVQIKTENGENIKGTQVVVSSNGQTISSVNTLTNGVSTFDNLETCISYEVSASKNDYHVNGVTALDLALVQRHILDVVDLNSPYKLIAADANNSGTITTLDLVEMQQLILGINSEYTNNTSWKFYDADHTFNNPNNPFTDISDAEMEIDFLVNNQAIGYTGVKIGDVNGSANVQEMGTGSATRNLAGVVSMSTINQKFEKGETVIVPITSSNLKDVLGYQFSMNYGASLTLSEIVPGNLNGLTTNNFAHFQENGIITSTWYGEAKGEKEKVLFTLNFIANESGNLKENIHVSSDITTAEAYNNKYEQLDIQLAFEDEVIEWSAFENVELRQNTPNPFIDQTTIGFVLPESGKANLSVFDVNGKIVKEINNDFSKGYHEVILNRKDFGTSGLLYYTLSSEYGTATRKMILIDKTIP